MISSAQQTIVMFHSLHNFIFRNVLLNSILYLQIKKCLGSSLLDPSVVVTCPSVRYIIKIEKEGFAEGCKLLLESKGKLLSPNRSMMLKC